MSSSTSHKADNLLLKNKLNDAMAELKALKKYIDTYEIAHICGYVGSKMAKGLVLHRSDQEWRKTISYIYNRCDNPDKLPRIGKTDRYWLTVSGCIGEKRQSTLQQFWNVRIKAIQAAMRKKWTYPQALTEKDAPISPIYKKKKFKSRNLMLADAVEEIQELKNLLVVMEHSDFVGDGLLDGIVPIPTDQEWRKTICDIYRRFNPSKLPQVDNLMLHWKGQKLKLIDVMRQIYVYPKRVRTEEEYVTPINQWGGMIRRVHPGGRDWTQD
tara:strand:- start:45 stop:851 length:807 start_codon:yes stop_codon:yes gene_type:complete